MRRLQLPWVLIGIVATVVSRGGVQETRQEKFGFSLPQTLDASLPRPDNADRGWIQRAVDAAAGRGGGRVTVPAGVHRTGTIWLRSHVELHLEKGAVIEASTNLEDYDKFPRNVCPITPEFCDKALVCAANAEDIAITGEGVIDGRGPEFYERTRCLPGREPYVVWEMKSLPRPRLLQFVRCRNIRVTGVTLKDAPAFTAYVRQCENVEVGSVTVVGNPRMPNNDGFDFDACRHVRAGDSTFFTGDDCFAFRAVREKCDPNPAVCEDVIVSNCSLRTHCQAIRIGCPSDDTIRNLLFKDIRMAGKNGVYFGNHLYCVRRDEEGYLDVSDVRFENFTGEITHSAVQMLVDPGIRLRRIDGISFKDFDVRTGRPIRFVGNAFSPIGRVSLENFKVTVARTNALVVAGAPGLVFTNVVLNGERRPDGPVAGGPGSSAPLVRKPPISWDNRPESSGAVVPDRGRLLTSYDFSDPTVWQADDGRYYATATTLNRLLVSWDLFRWEDAGRKVVADETRRQLNEIALRDKERGRHVHLGLWAPDVVRVGKRWIMTLAARTSGQNAKIVALAADRPEGPFADPVVLVDGGELQIVDAIDPEIIDENGRLWLFFGSLGGIHRIELAADCRSVKPGAVPVHVAGRKANFRLTDVQQSRYGHFEGAYLHRHDGWWYLFASGGRYADESYRIVVGRSQTLDGTFVDRQGRPMTEGRGETILSSEKGDRFYGPGHNGEIFTNDGRWWMFYHVHDRNIPGKTSYVPRPMAIQEIKWDADGWPFFETGRPQLEY